MARSKVGLHCGTGPGMTGVMDNFITPINASGIPVHIKSVNNTGFVAQVVQSGRKHGVKNVVVLRFALDFQYDNPNYDAPNPEEEMTSYYLARVKPRLEAAKELYGMESEFWVELLNEPDKNRWGIVCRWAKKGLELLNADGYKGVAIAANAGEPEPISWEIPESLALLRYCAANPDKAGISLHEGFTHHNIYDTEASELYPFLMGRFTYLHSACDKFNIDHPTLFISELAWAHNDMPETAKAIRDIDFYSRLYNEHPNIKGGFLWNLNDGGAWGTLPSQLNSNLASISNYIMTTDLPNIEPPTSDCPPFDYSVIYHLYHQQSITDAEYDEIARYAKNAGFQTVCGSADDVANMVSRGKPPTPIEKGFSWVGVYSGTRAIVWNPERWENSIDDYLYERGVLQIEHRYVTDTNPPEPPTNDPYKWEYPVRAKAGPTSDPWPEKWFSAVTFAQRYTNPGSGKEAYHTGDDLNYDGGDYGLEFYSPADGIVTFSQSAPVWGKVLVIRHDDPLGTIFTRYAHMKDVFVSEGDTVKKGQKIGTVGDGDGLFGAHLHHDVSANSYILATNPTNWPGLDLDFLLNNYVSPAQFYLDKQAEIIPLPTTPTPPPSGGYTGPPVSYKSYIHGPADDWRWNEAGFKQTMSSLIQKGMSVKYLSNGINGDIAPLSANENTMVRLFWKPDKKKTPAEAWVEDIRDGALRFYNKGYRDFEVHNEPNLPEEGWGLVWQNATELGNWLVQFIQVAKAEMPNARFWFPGMSPGVPWTNQFAVTSPAWAICKNSFYGVCLHAYTGIIDNSDAAANDIVNQVVEAQRFLFLDKPMFISEVSVNRANPNISSDDNARYKADVYMKVDALLKKKQGIKGVAWFVSYWQGNPEHQENWHGTILPSVYVPS